MRRNHGLVIAAGPCMGRSIVLLMARHGLAVTLVGTDRPLEVVRADIGVTPKSPRALTAGSVGPWEVGGITPYQLDAARRAATERGSDYLPWSPDPARDRR